MQHARDGRINTEVSIYIYILMPVLKISILRYFLFTSDFV